VKGRRAHSRRYTRGVQRQKILATGKLPSPVFYYLAHDLSEGAKRELLSLLEVDGTKAKSAFRKVEAALGRYDGLVENLENAPRAIEYREIFSAVRNDAARLANDIANLGGYFRDALTAEGLDIHAAEISLASLHTAASAAVARHSEKESRGRSKQQALRHVVACLLSVFEEYRPRGGEDDQRTISGNQSNLSERDNEELEFVRRALKDAKILHPKTARELRALILAVESARAIDETKKGS
jgi:hypothetical protein